MTAYFIAALESFWNWILDYLKYAVDYWLNPLADAIPDLTPQTTVICEYLSYVNDWVALDFGFGLLGFYMTFISIMICAKLVIKLFIPTVG